MDALIRVIFRKRSIRAFYTILVAEQVEEAVAAAAVPVGLSLLG